jgi:stage IV sporulation protein FB
MESENNQQSTYPEKPIIDQKSASSKTLVSFLIWAVSFYFLFDQNFKMLAIIAVVLIIHELGHFVAMKIYNYNDVKMFFIPFVGALVTGNKKEISQKQKIFVLLAGPVPGIIIGLILYVLGSENNSSELIKIANLFIFINAFNLLPMTPLDGGQLIDTMFINPNGGMQKIFILLSALGMAVLAITLETYFLLIIPFFLLIQLGVRGKMKEIKQNLNDEQINFNQDYEELSNEEFWRIREQIIDNISAFKKYNSKDYTPVKQEKQIVNYVKSLNLVPQMQDLTKGLKAGILSIWIIVLISPLFVLKSFAKTNNALSFEDQYNIQLENCIESIGEIAEEHPKVSYEYCSCIVDETITAFTEEELTAHENLPKLEKDSIFQSLITKCVNKFKAEISGDIESDTSTILE